MSTGGGYDNNVEVQKSQDDNDNCYDDKVMGVDNYDDDNTGCHPQKNFISLGHCPKESGFFLKVLCLFCFASWHLKQREKVLKPGSTLYVKCSVRHTHA